MVPETVLDPAFLWPFCFSRHGPLVPSDHISYSLWPQMPLVLFLCVCSWAEKHTHTITTILSTTVLTAIIILFSRFFGLESSFSFPHFLSWFSPFYLIPLLPASLVCICSCKSPIQMEMCMPLLSQFKTQNSNGSRDAEYVLLFLQCHTSNLFTDINANWEND